MHIFYSRLFFILFIFSSLAYFSSCKISKHAAILLDNAEEQLLEKISEESVDYNWFSAKAKVRIESDRIKGGGRMNIRMVQDSIIWFNFKKVSIEGARGIINPQTFTIIYRTEKKYEKGALTDIFNSETLEVSFGEIQSYIAGKIELPFKSTIEYKKDEDHHLLLGRNDKYDLLYKFDEELNFIRYEMSDNQNRQLVIELDSFDEELRIYKNRKLTYFQNQNKQGTLELDLSNIEIDVPKNLPFSIPDHYTQY